MHIETHIFWTAHSFPWVFPPSSVFHYPTGNQNRGFCETQTSKARKTLHRYDTFAEDVPLDRIGSKQDVMRSIENRLSRASGSARWQESKVMSRGHLPPFVRLSSMIVTIKENLLNSVYICQHFCLILSSYHGINFYVRYEKSAENFSNFSHTLIISMHSITRTSPF